MSQIKVDSIVPAGGVPAGAKGGGIIQVLEYIQPAAVSQSVASTARNSWQDLTGFSLSITPRSSSNKVMIIAHLHVGGASNQHYFMSAFRFTRGGSVITGALGNSRTNFEQATSSHNRGTHDGNGLNVVSIMYIDSPATTSATTYKIQMQCEQNPFYLNRTQRDDDNQNYSLAPISTLHLMEISG